MRKRFIDCVKQRVKQAVRHFSIPISSREVVVHLIAALLAASFVEVIKVVAAVVIV
ncbi:MAG: hypothetical protein AABN34_23310 [Acidobacteriota bacterium]